MALYVLKNPDPYTRAVKVYSDTQPGVGFELMTEAAFVAWLASQPLPELAPPPTPAPDWARFKRVALGSDTLNSILVAAYQSVPVAAGALAPALLRAETSDAADFAAAWGAIRRALPVPLEVVAGFVAVATACNLPAEFVAALQPSPN